MYCRIFRKRPSRISLDDGPDDRRRIWRERRESGDQLELLSGHVRYGVERDRYRDRHVSSTHGLKSRLIPRGLHRRAERQRQTGDIRVNLRKRSGRLQYLRSAHESVDPAL
eukprot:scaffold7052_cov254-Pinguiococcus_pyrenoidosus.AAC.99